MQKLYLSVKEVAERYGVSVKTVWTWSRNGVLPRPIHLGNRCTRWNLKDLEDFEDQTREGGAAAGEAA